MHPKSMLGRQPVMLVSICCPAIRLSRYSQIRFPVRRVRSETAPLGADVMIPQPDIHGQVDGGTREIPGSHKER